jgi:hypothetical protein
MHLIATGEIWVYWGSRSGRRYGDEPRRRRRLPHTVSRKETSYPPRFPTIVEPIRVVYWPRQIRSTPSSLVARGVLVPRSHLAANVEEVVDRLVQGVCRDPAQRPLMRFWVVVDHGAIPVVFAQAGEDIAE